MLKICIVLSLFCLFGCATAPCRKTTAGEDDDEDDGATVPPRAGETEKMVPPPMTQKEMAAVVRESPKLECTVKDSRVTLTLKGRLDSFNYGWRGLKHGFQVCLIGEITEWRHTQELCRDHVAGVDHVYTFGPILLPKKNHEHFTFASVARGKEYRWVAVKWLNPTGDCRTFMGEEGNRDDLVFTKHE